MTTRWGLAVREAMPGGTSRTFRCQQGDATVFLKLTPDPRPAAREAGALHTWRACSHLVTLLDTDLDSAALLLAAIHPGTALSSHATQPPPTAIAALLGALRTEWTGSLPPLDTLLERVDFLFALTRRRRDGTPAAVHVSDRLLRRCQDHARGLAATGDRGLVHGDLHPANVLESGPHRSLVAIDPRPCLGDPDFDAVNWVVGGIRSESDVRHRIAEPATLVPGMDPVRVLAWTRALAVALAVPRLCRGVHDMTTKTLLDLARNIPAQ